MRSEKNTMRIMKRKGLKVLRMPGDVTDYKNPYLKQDAGYLIYFIYWETIYSKYSFIDIIKELNSL